MAEALETTRKKKSLTQVVNDFISQNSPYRTASKIPTYAGDEEGVDWMAVGRGNKIGPQTWAPPTQTIKTDNSGLPKVDQSAPSNPGTGKRTTDKRTTTTAPASTVPTASASTTQVPASQATPTSTIPAPSNTSSSQSSYTPTDRSNYQSYAQTIARLQNDPKVLALRQKLAQIKLSGDEQKSSVESAYAELPNIIRENLVGQRRRITDTYNQRGLYGSGMEIGNLNQADQSAQSAIASAEQKKADEIASIIRNLGLLEMQTNDQISQVEGSSGDIIAQTLFNLNQQADQTDNANRQWSANYDMQREQMQNQLANQDWTRNFQERQYNDDQTWRQREYDLDLQRLNQQIADAAAESEIENMSPGTFARYQVSQYDDPQEALEDFASGQMAGIMADPQNQVSQQYVWDLLRQKFGWSSPYSPEVVNQYLQQSRYPNQLGPFRPLQ